MVKVKVYNDMNDLVVDFFSDAVKEDVADFNGFKGWYYTTEGERLWFARYRNDKQYIYNTITTCNRGYKRLL